MKKQRYYNILIADDIEWIRKGVISVLSKKYNFVYFEAENGEDALHIIKNQQIDLVVTDVKMPVRDGLSFIEETLHMGMDMPVIVISGFSEFEFVRKALNLGAKGYILKPIEDSQIYNEVDKALRVILNQNMQKNMIVENRALKRTIDYEKNMKEIASVLLFGEKGDETLKKPCLLMLIEIGKDYAKESFFEENDSELIKYSIQNIALELFYLFEVTIINHPQNLRQLLLILSHKREIILKTEREVCAVQLLKSIKEYIGLQVMMGVSRVHEEVCADLYKEGLHALCHKIILPDCHVFYYDGNRDFDVDRIRIDFLRTHIKDKNIRKIRNALQELLLENNLEGIDIEKFIRYIFDSVYNALTLEYGVQAYSVINLNETSDLSCFESMEDVKNYLENMISLLLDQDLVCRDNEDMIKKIRSIIEKDYNKDINLKDFAEKFTISYTYLSSLFKQQTGMSFVKYILKMRLEKTAELLIHSNEDISTIAYMVGYDDIQYFYRKFKQYYNQTPMNYRNIYKKVQ